MVVAVSGRVDSVTVLRESSDGICVTGAWDKCVVAGCFSFAICDSLDAFISNWCALGDTSIGDIAAMLSHNGLRGDASPRRRRRRLMELALLLRLLLDRLSVGGVVSPRPWKSGKSELLLRFRRAELP